jgi:hypothetical protein
MMLLDPKVKAEKEDLLAIAFGPDHRRNRKLIRSGPLDFNAAKTRAYFTGNIFASFQTGAASLDLR